MLGTVIPPRSPVALFDFPNYANVGDSLIWLGAELYLEANGNPVVAVAEASSDFGLLPDLSEDVVVVIQGGGNFGDLWPLHQEFREFILGKYRKNRVVQLPQSIHFESTAALDRSAAVMRAHRDFHLLVRDRQSFLKASAFSARPPLLCPDMAFLLQRVERVRPPSLPVLALLRSDKESAIPRGGALGAGFVVRDWVSEPLLPSGFDRAAERDHAPGSDYYRFRRYAYCQLARQRFHRGVDLLSQAAVVITDRLHAHVLCSLMRVPHVVIDNRNGKLGAFMDTWGAPQGLCRRAADVAEAKELVKSLSGSRSVPASEDP